MTTPFQPLPCDASAGAAAGADVEQTLLCDVLADGTVAGTALAVYEYDSDGNPAGPPIFVVPGTNDPYVAQGVLQPCPGEVGCLEPVVFHTTTTATGPVDHPGRQYDITLPINPGFAVQSLQVDQVTNAANIVWDVADPDGEQFRQDLTSFIDARIPSAATVTITNPNAGQTICGTAAPMLIHIECLRLDQSPPDLIELVYNGGQDLVINPAYNETPPLNPPVAQGNYGFHLLARQDDPGPFPGNPPAGRANCTNTANRGWETNDIGRTFEIWGQDQVNGQNVTPTPRGTPTQEITSDGPPPGGRSTIWQTFQAPATANFVIRVVHGARDAGENHRITLDNGDTDAAQNGDLIDDVTTPAVVTSSPGGPGPWTQFSQTIPLTAGNIYTLALSTNNPLGPNRGGLFTDMRAFIDRPDLRATATVDDDTCVVTVDETTTVCDDQLWSPICRAGEIESWQNAETGEILSNSAFWGQAPAPVPGPCPAPASGGTGGSVAANLVHTYTVCATVGGVRTNLQRVVISDASGGVLADTFVGPDGGPVPTPSQYSIGSCTDTAFMNDAILCDDNGPFLRKYVQSISATGQAEVKSHRDFALGGGVYDPVGTVHQCGDGQTLGPVCYILPPNVVVQHRGFLALDGEGAPVLYDDTGAVVAAGSYAVVQCLTTYSAEEILCDAGNDGHPFVRRYLYSPQGNLASQVPAPADFELNGFTPYVAVGPVGACGPGDCATTTTLLVCDLPTGDPDGAPVVTDTNQQFIADLPNADFVQRPGGGGALWTGGAINMGPDVSTGPGITQVHRYVAATLQAAPPSCTDGTVHIDASVQVQNLGPGAGCSGVGRFRLFRVSDGAVLVAGSSPPLNTPVGDVSVLTINGSVPAADLAAGNVAVWLDLETFQTGVCAPPDGKQWQASNFTAAYAYGQDGCASEFFRTVVTDCTTGETLATVDTTPDGDPYVVTGEVGSCSASSSAASPCPCVSADEIGEAVAENITTRVDAETQVLCDSTGARFLRAYTFDAAGAVSGFADRTLANAAFVPTGAVTTCSGDRVDAESVILCDSAASPNRFVRTYTYDAAGVITGFTDRTLGGAAFVPTGAVGVCAQTVQSDTDFVEEILCDSNGTAFIRLFRFNSTTGALISTTNTTLAGAAFNPVGTVGVCSDCCPNVVGQGCTNTGSGFYTAIRATTGAITLIDSVSGAAITAANIVPCPSDDTTRTLTAQHRLVADADTPWSPGNDVVGTLTSVTYVVLSGTATVTDQNGTVAAGLPSGLSATWSADDDNTLSGPTSIDAVGGSVYVHWTQR